VFIIYFTHSRTYKSILKFSNIIIQKQAEIVYAHTNDLSKRFEKIPQNGTSFLRSIGQISMENTDLILFMQEQVKIYPDLYSFFVGTREGFLINVTNLAVSKQKNFFSETQKPLPPEAAYSFWIVDNSLSQPTGTYIYYDKNFTEIDKEIIPDFTFDPRKRPWYVGAAEDDKLYWSDVYIFNPIKVPGITISNPFYNKEGALIGVAGADLSLNTLSNFLLDQKVGISGKVLILDSKTGQILLPLSEDEAAKEPTVFSSLARKSFNLFKDTKKNSFIINDNRVDYLNFINTFEWGDNSWSVLVTVPLLDFFKEIFDTQKLVALISTLIFAIAGTLVIFFSKRISKPISLLATEVDKITKLNMTGPIRVKSNIREIIILDKSIDELRKAIISFAKYVPKKLVSFLIQTGQEIKIGGEKQEIVIMFSDIVGFTPIAEKLSVDKLMVLLEEYFDKLSQTILEAQGTIDKYIGDSVMAFWGAPEKIKDPAIQACQALLRSSSQINLINEKRQKDQLPEFITKFGLDMGMAFIGNIGTQERINYTAIGDVINSAARLQALNKTYHSHIIITENVLKNLNSSFITRPLDTVMVKGKQSQIKIYELLAQDSQDPLINGKPSDRELCKIFTEAYLEFEKNNKERALELFRQIEQKFPNDEPTKIYLSKLNS
jgi:adenylate cyclase